MINWIILIILTITGVFDLWLYFSDQKTLSQGWIFDKIGVMFGPPKWLMRAIMIVLLILTWWLFGGIETFIKVLIGIIIGHLCWQD